VNDACAGVLLIVWLFSIAIASDCTGAKLAPAWLACDPLCCLGKLALHTPH
jgi:hypothetical protein